MFLLYHINFNDACEVHVARLTISLKVGYSLSFFILIILLTYDDMY